jgi:type IX secretion system PorP/SprF family membrane protein
MKYNKTYTLLRLIVTLQISLLLFVCQKVHAQTEPMYSQYMYNMLGVNPAYAGNREVISLNFFQRNQWVGIKGAPKTTSVSLDKAGDSGKWGWGIQLYDDQLGVESASGANLMFSTKVRLSQKGYLSGGLSLGMMNYRIGLLDVMRRNTPSDNTFISVDNPSKLSTTVGLGIYYNTDNFYAGIASPSVLKSRLASYENFSSGIQKTNDFHLFVTAGYVIEMNDVVKLKPSTMVKMVSGAPIEFDLNANLWLNDIIGLGASYRTGDAYVGMVEIQANEHLRIGYAYDMPFTPLNYFTRGSHELMLRYEFGNFKTSIKSTRYF